MDSPKNQITDRLKQANNVLVTVSANPSVDQLAAAIGLTLLLNKLGKHATAVFSGQIPNTIEFLQPEKTLEKTTDSLRDFIIALDKAKADKLRYKVEDQMVKIFITPYRTSITDKDLEFSQGDFNVEVVMALGVNEQKDLDQAITSHGRILHDATVIGVNTQGEANLGSINWVQPEASSLCEMLLSLGLGMNADVLDGQMATAFLTGIVAETNRFSNEKTSSDTMQLSAKLMAAGANQQLVASQLQPPAVDIPKDNEAPAKEEDAELPEVADDEQAAPPAEMAANEDAPPVDGSLQIDHGNSKPLIDLNAEPDQEEPEEDKLEQIHIDNDGIIKTADEIDAMKQKVVDPLPEDDPTTEKHDPSRLITQPPTPGLGGTLTANSTPEGLDPSTDPLGVTAAQSPLLSHDSPSAGSPLNTPVDGIPVPTAQDIIGASPYKSPVPDPEPSIPSVESPNTLSDLEKVVDSPHVTQESETSAPAPNPSGSDVNAARDAVMQAVSGATPHVLEPVQSLNAQPMDLNLGDMPAVATSPASAFGGDNTVTNPPVAGSMVNPSTGATTDSGTSSGLVPPDPGLPVDNTASAVDQAAPPPVPPPLIPPVMPTGDDSATPS